MSFSRWFPWVAVPVALLLVLGVILDESATEIWEAKKRESNPPITKNHERPGSVGCLPALLGSLCTIRVPRRENLQCALPLSTPAVSDGIFLNT